MLLPQVSHSLGKPVKNNNEKVVNNSSGKVAKNSSGKVVNRSSNRTSNRVTSNGGGNVVAIIRAIIMQKVKTFTIPMVAKMKKQRAVAVV